MASGAASGKAVSPIKLKFIFANHDGVVVEHSVNPAMLIKDLKGELMGRWPSAVEPVTEFGRVRLICMGFGILPDNKSLTDGTETIKQSPGGAPGTRNCCAIS